MIPRMDECIEFDRGKFQRIIERMIASSTGTPVVTEKNVYQEGNPTNKPLLYQIVGELLLPGSTVLGFENLLELRRIARKKKPCLILMEHFSNFDIPCFYRLLEGRGREGREIADSIVSIAGIKLNEESRLSLAFTEIFTRVVLVPKSESTRAMDAKARWEMETRKLRLNYAAMKALMKLRKEGRLILIFPTGTRYRPWDPSTGRGLKEVNSYLKSYSYMVSIAINGNTLLPNPGGGLDEDFPRKDVMIYTVSPVQKCSEFRHEALKSHSEEHDRRQHVADHLMAALSALHQQTEKFRLTIPNACPEG
jgi:1-acyl-sn-glycerol-3-phosphate acyltransferase